MLLSPHSFTCQAEPNFTQFRVYTLLVVLLVSKMQTSKRNAGRIFGPSQTCVIVLPNDCLAILIGEAKVIEQSKGRNLKHVSPCKAQFRCARTDTWKAMPGHFGISMFLPTGIASLERNPPTNCGDKIIQSKKTD